jgi:SHO1 osmosensor
MACTAFDNFTLISTCLPVVVKVSTLHQYLLIISFYSHQFSHWYSFSRSFFPFTYHFTQIAWFLAFISQCIVTADGMSLVFLSQNSQNLINVELVDRDAVGTLWFAIFVQLFLILGVLYTLATDSIAMHRFQISVFGAIAIVFAVQGVNQGLFVSVASLNAMGTGWLLLAIVDILWVLYFTSEEDSLALHVFNMLGNGGLSSPSRRRRTRTQSVMHDMPSGNGYPTNYALGGGISSHDGYDSKIGTGAYGSPIAGGIRSQNSFGGSLNDNLPKGTTGGTGGPASLRNEIGAGSIANGVDNGPSSPLMVGVGAGGSTAASNPDQLPPSPQPDAYLYKAKALYACEFISSSQFNPYLSNVLLVL